MLQRKTKHVPDPRTCRARTVHNLFLAACFPTPPKGGVIDYKDIKSFSMMLQPIDYTLPIVAALIGWLTNGIAVKMLFRPRKPHKLFGITVHGVFPKRQKDLAAKMSRVIADEFVASGDLAAQLESVMASPKLRQSIETHIRSALASKAGMVMPFLPVALLDSLGGKLGEAFSSELDNLMAHLKEEVLQDADKTFDVQPMKEKRIAEFPVEKLEQLIMQVLKTEFQFIEFFGGVLGFIIGLVQLALMQIKG